MKTEKLIFLALSLTFLAVVASFSRFQTLFLVVAGVIVAAGAVIYFARR